MSSSWFVYFLRCADNSLYCGVTVDLPRRVKEHNLCDRHGAKYTRARRPVTLCYAESLADRAAACAREYQLKQLTKKQKEALVSGFDRDTYLKHGDV